MREVWFLTCQYGENATTPRDIVAPWVGQTRHHDCAIVPDATIACCVNSDDNRLTPVPLWGWRLVSLPDWMAPDEFVRHEITYKYALSYGLDPAWCESWGRGLMALQRHSSVHVVVACALLRTKKFRSAFRASVRDRIVEWLETPAESRQYKSPMSDRMLACLARPDDYRHAKHDARYYMPYIVQDATLPPDV